MEVFLTKQRMLNPECFLRLVSEKQLISSTLSYLLWLHSCPYNCWPQGVYVGGGGGGGGGGGARQQLISADLQIGWNINVCICDDFYHVAVSIQEETQFYNLSAQIEENILTCCLRVDLY